MKNILRQENRKVTHWCLVARCDSGLVEGRLGRRSPLTEFEDLGEQILPGNLPPLAFHGFLGLLESFVPDWQPEVLSATGKVLTDSGDGSARAGRQFVAAFLARIFACSLSS